MCEGFVYRFGSSNMGNIVSPEVPLRIIFWVSGAFSVASCVLSFFLLYKHLRYFSVPREQKWIVRILLMVPIYAIDSWISLRFVQVAPYFNLIRDAYEGYVLFAFLQLLICYIEGEDEGSAGDKLAERGPVKLPLPLCCISFQPGHYFLLWVKRLTLQYALIRPLTAIIALVLEPFGLYCEGNFSLGCAYLYITVVVNVSVAVALYWLVLFYLAAKEDIEQVSLFLSDCFFHCSAFSSSNLFPSFFPSKPFCSSRFGKTF